MTKHFCDMCGKELKLCEGAVVVIEKRDFTAATILAKEVCEECAEKLKDQFIK